MFRYIRDWFKERFHVHRWSEWYLMSRSEFEMSSARIPYLIQERQCDTCGWRETLIDYDVMHKY